MRIRGQAAGEAPAAAGDLEHAPACEIALRVEMREEQVVPGSVGLAVDLVTAVPRIVGRAWRGHQAASASYALSTGSAARSHVYRLSAMLRASMPSRARNARSSINRLMAATIAPRARIGVSSPVCSCSITSFMPHVDVVTIGRPLIIACINVRGV